MFLDTLNIDCLKDTLLWITSYKGILLGFFLLCITTAPIFHKKHNDFEKQ